MCEMRVYFKRSYFFLVQQVTLHSTIQLTVPPTANNIYKTDEMGGCPLGLRCHLHAKLLFVFIYHVQMLKAVLPILF